MALKGGDGMRRRHVNWDEELRKTEAIRMRGFRISAFGFVMGFLFLVGSVQLNDKIPFGRNLLLIGYFVVAFGVLAFLWRRSAKRQKEAEFIAHSEDEHKDEGAK
jgi:hypothetical protein